MNVQPTSLARSRANIAKRRGRKATKRGRPYKDVGKKVVVDGKLYPAQAAPKKRNKDLIMLSRSLWLKTNPPPEDMIDSDE